jgi:SAM-dependent methyltransferase
MRLQSDDELEQSAVVANCRMNRERDLTGSNGYDREIGFNPLDFLTGRTSSGRPVAWLDLCCGTGKALIQAARAVHAGGLDVEVVGVDLVGMFHRPDPGLTRLRLVEASLRSWQPERAFDLITCVHGLHYVGDKLGLIARSAAWLVEDGLFVANLDAENLKLDDGPAAVRRAVAGLRRCGLEYDGKQKRVLCRGHRALDLPFRYLGADDQAGPNFTGQPAVNSHYEVA